MMNRSLFTLLLLAIATFSSAQKTLDSGVITFELTNLETGDNDMDSEMEMFESSKTQVAFTNEYALLNVAMMEGMMSMKTIKTLSTGNVNLYLDLLGNKMLVSMTSDEREEMTQKAIGDDVKWDVTYDKSDTKVISGYTCHKAVVTSTKDDFSLECYLSPDINADTNLLYGFEAFSLDGFPLEYTTTVDGSQMTYTATTISDEADAKLFKINESEYKKMSFEDFSQMSQSLGGGMGF